MRNCKLKSYGAAFAGLTGLVANLLLAPVAEAADYSNRRGIKPAAAQAAFDPHHQSIVRLSERDFPLHRGIKLGRNKSMLIEVPVELRDVIVSSPDIVDAVVQSSNRVYLIGKKVGQANAFFFDTNGQQIATIELIVEHDTVVLDTLYKRLLPGSNIKTEVLNETVILTGTVRNPADQPAAGRGRGAGHAPGQGGRGRANCSEAVRDQPRGRAQYRQLRHGDHDQQRPADHDRGRTGRHVAGISS
jgi:pilus assembly protein CpaC